MHSQLQSVFDSAEEEKNRLIAHVSVLSFEEYFRIPAPDKWSIAQIMTHLMVAEQLSLGYMKKKSLGIEQVKDSGAFTEARFRFYNVVLGLPVKLKAPKAILDNTPEPLPLSDLEVNWKRTRNKLKAFLSTIEDKHVHRLIFKHAFAGRLSAIHALRFFIEHIHHHRPQIDKIMHSSKR
jgi:uncharacterized damage-inducible protein DinB